MSRHSDDKELMELKTSSDCWFGVSLPSEVVGHEELRRQNMDAYVLHFFTT